MKAKFIRKPTGYELVHNQEFIVEKTIELKKKEFESILDNPLQDRKVIEENKHLMHIDKNDVVHCIFLHTSEQDFGILVNSEGYSYLRYACLFPKNLILKDNNVPH